MTIPVLICDDSSFARKQVVRSLPEKWDVDLSFAKNGEEALQLIRQGKADILFLDLTMPVMDGFEVLEAIRAEDLHSLPIVISGDIQPESERRVKSLGAVSFLKKPIVPAELKKVLTDYGLLQLSDESKITYDEQVDFTDWCQELANVAKGRAADLLARFINHPVELSIPKVEYLQRNKLRDLFMDQENVDSNDYIISQGFTGAGIAGEMILTFDNRDSERIHQLLYTTNDKNPQDSDLEAIMDMANILSGAFLKGLSEQIDVLFSIGQPITRTHKEFAKCCQQTRSNERDEILRIGCDYTIANEISCSQWLLFSDTAAQALKSRASALTE